MTEQNKKDIDTEALNYSKPISEICYNSLLQSPAVRFLSELAVASTECEAEYAECTPVTEYRVGDILDYGGSCECRRAIQIHTGKSVALKILYAYNVEMKEKALYEIFL